jgi:hypothetical protein
VFVGPWLIDKSHAQCAKGGNQAAGVPAKDPAQYRDRQQNPGRTPDATIKMVAEQKALQVAVAEIHGAVIVCRANKLGFEAG